MRLASDFLPALEIRCQGDDLQHTHLTPDFQITRRTPNLPDVWYLISNYLTDALFQKYPSDG